MPTAVFHAVEGLAAHEQPQRHYGRAAVAAYVEGIEGRLMRSMKSILGSTLAQQSTEVGAGRSVFFVDDDAQRDAGAQAVLVQVARKAGFADIHLQYEPVAAALNDETTLQRQQRVRAAAVGGGTSDFSLVRGDPFASVAWGLGMHALRLFGAAS